jgi:hypothetical protein
LPANTPTGVAKAQNFFMVFDDLHSTASLLDAGTLVKAPTPASPSRRCAPASRNLPSPNNRNDGVLALTPLAGYGGILTGECRRSPPPPGTPNPA